MSPKPPSPGKTLDTARTLAELRFPPLSREELKQLSKGIQGSTQRIGIAQIKSDPTNINENVSRIVNAIRIAKRKGAELLVGVECGIPGYLSMDRLYDKGFIERNVAALGKILPETHGITVVVGFVDAQPDVPRSGGRTYLYNSAAILRDGKVLGYTDKNLLATYNILDDDRHFATSSRSPIIELGDTRIGICICEDMWAKEEHYTKDPVARLVKRGANLILNLSASPFHIAKQDIRRTLVSDVAKSHGVPVVYANLVGSYDGFEGEVPFDGRSLVANAQGEFLAEAKSFEEDVLVVDLHSKAQKLPEHHVTEELHAALVLGIQDYMRRLRGENKKVVIGLSGGIDSAVVAALAVEALGKENVIGATLPSRFNSPETFDAALRLALNLGIELKVLPIEDSVQSVRKTMKNDEELAKLPEGVADENVQARMRMIYLMYLGNALNAIVLNTGNKTELALNNCTIYGDMVGGFSVLGDVDKDRVYDLARHINKTAGKELIPQFTIDVPPTAELKENQIDADVMGDDPARLAPMVRDIIEHNLSPQETFDRWGTQYTQGFILKTHQKIANAEWKRRQAAPAIRVTRNGFNVGRRMPMGTVYQQQEEFNDHAK